MITTGSVVAGRVRVDGLVAEPASPAVTLSKSGEL